LPPTVVATPEYRGAAGAAVLTDAASIDFSPFDGARLLAGYADGGVRIWDLRAALGAHHSNVRSIRPIDTVRPHAPGAHVTCVQWCPHDRHVFASGGADANVVLTRAGGRAAAEALFVHCGHTGVIHDVSWSYAEAGLIVSCDDDGIIAWAPKSALLQ
jgi:WD40 repeat protein